MKLEYPLEEKDIRRFHAFVHEGAPSQCWTWKGAHAGGDGARPMFWLAGTTISAAKVAYRVHYGAWPENALHSCDNGWCMNWVHLHDGTHQDNMNEREARHRHAHRPTTAKLTDDQVREIRAVYGPRRSQGPSGGRITYAQLSEIYGISVGQLSALIQGRSYRHVS